MRTASARSRSLSNSAGTVTAHATTTLSVAGSAPFTVATDGAAPNSGDAVKLVRRREHPDRARYGEQPVGDEPHADRPCEREHRHRRRYVNAPAGTIIMFSLILNAGAGQLRRRCDHLHDGRGDGLLHRSDHVSDTTGTTTVGPRRRVRQRRDAARARRVTRRPATARTPEDWARRHRPDGHPQRRERRGDDGSGRHGRPRPRAGAARRPGRPPSVPNPTGTVVFHRYATIDCTGDGDRPVGRADPGRSVDGGVGRLRADGEHLLQGGLLGRRELPGAYGRLRAADGDAGSAARDRDRQEPEEPDGHGSAGRRGSRSRSRTSATRR